MSWWGNTFLPDAWAKREAAARREGRQLLHKDERLYTLPASEDDIRAMDEGNVPNVRDRNERKED